MNVPVPQMETWETTVETTMYLKQTDPRGREYHTKVGGRVGAKFSISAEDRELNQLQTADAVWDVFTNGMLVPIRKTAENDELRTPNQLTEAELKGLLTKSGQAFASAVKKIDSETTLRRLKAIAVELDARPSQMSLIDAALEPYSIRPFASKVGVPDVGPGSEH
ncbi:MAG: hypothetical protein ACXVYY_01425 [Oryzihumus sp.]